MPTYTDDAQQITVNIDVEAAPPEAWRAVVDFITPILSFIVAFLMLILIVKAIRRLLEEERR